MTRSDLHQGGAAAGNLAAAAAPDSAARRGAEEIAPGLLPESPADRNRSRSRTPLWRSLVTGTGALGTGLVLLVVLLGLFAPVLAPYGPEQQLDGAYLLNPSWTHWFGTDDLNRDVLSRVLYGIRVDLLIVFTAVPIGAAIGTLAGLVTVGHPVSDVLAQRVFDVILAFPALILGIALTAILGPSGFTVALVIALAEIPIFARLTRTAVLRVREQPYVEAARVSGAGPIRILARHVLPNSVEALGVQFALSLSLAVFLDGALSFLGVGVPAPTPTLGAILAAGNGYLETNPWFAVAPLLVISLLVLGFYLIAQAISRSRRI